MALCPNCPTLLKENDELKEALKYLLDNPPEEWSDSEVRRIKELLHGCEADDPEEK